MQALLVHVFGFLLNANVLTLKNTKTDNKTDDTSISETSKTRKSLLYLLRKNIRFELYKLKHTKL